MKHKIIGFVCLLSIFQCSLFAQDLEYNKNYTIACHNCYEPKDNRNIEDVFPYTTTIEIDIWDNEIASGRAAEKLKSKKMDVDWFVKHQPEQQGNLNCCGGTFKDCLNRIKDWGNTNPDHNVITIFIDKKENWSDPNEKRKPRDLDELLLSIFTKEKIFKPSDLLQKKQNLKLAVDNWPILNSLKGKFIFVITDGSIQFYIPFLLYTRTPLNEYLEVQKNSAVCFVAPEISEEQSIGQPSGFSKENAQNVVFYNLKYPSGNLPEKINSINCLSRIFNSPETIESYNDLINKKVNFIAVDSIKLASTL